MPSNEIWDKGYYSCDVKRVFGDRSPLTMTAKELDEVCRAAGIVWEVLDNNEIQVHACGMHDCYCHGGSSNPNLRPR